MKNLMKKIGDFYEEFFSDFLGKLFFICLFFFFAVVLIESNIQRNLSEENKKLKMAIAEQKEIIRMQVGMLHSMTERLKKESTK